MIKALLMKKGRIFLPFFSYDKNLIKRFIDFRKCDTADIDIDFICKNKDKINKYILRKFGKEV
jgi:hypothetical protein